MKIIVWTRRTLVPAVLVLSLALAACPKTPPNLSPHDTAVFKATQVIDKLNLATDVIISLNHQTAPVIPDKIEVILLDTIKSVAKIAAATPDGWLPAARVAFAEGKAKLTPAEQTQYAGYLLLIETVLTAVG